MIVVNSVVTSAARRYSGPGIAARNAAPAGTLSCTTSATEPIARCSIVRCYASTAIMTSMPSNGSRRDKIVARLLRGSQIPTACANVQRAGDHGHSVIVGVGTGPCHDLDGP
jgi:hypothetical protein